MMNVIRALVDEKVSRYNNASDGARYGQAKEYLYELKGMQELLLALGIEMDMMEDEEFNLVCSIEAK